MHALEANLIRQYSKPIQFTLERNAKIGKSIAFDGLERKIELFRGEWIEKNPAGPVHDDLITYLTHWSVRSADPLQTCFFRTRTQRQRYSYSTNAFRVRDFPYSAKNSWGQLFDIVEQLSQLFMELAKASHPISHLMALHTSVKILNNLLWM